MTESSCRLSRRGGCCMLRVCDEQPAEGKQLSSAAISCAGVVWELQRWFETRGERPIVVPPSPRDSPAACPLRTLASIVPFQLQPGSASSIFRSSRGQSSQRLTPPQSPDSNSSRMSLPQRGGAHCLSVGNWESPAAAPRGGVGKRPRVRAAGSG